MKNMTLFLASALMFASCSAQTEAKSEVKRNDNKIGQTQEPTVNYRVSKEYDEKCNLIKYDSTHTYYYSNADTVAMMNDSVFDKFNEFFSTKSIFKNGFDFNEFFGERSDFKDHFFSEDYFRKSFRRSQDRFNEMLFQMDSVKNRFLMEEFPIENSGKEN